MISVRKAAMGVALVGTTLTGGALGAALISGIATAQTPTSTVAPTAPGAPSAGIDSSNSDATHEAGESAQREADETAGKVGEGQGGHSNTDPAHEAAESPARAAEEAARDAASPTPTAGPTATAG
jgi:hypothetical protein